MVFLAIVCFSLVIFGGISALIYRTSPHFRRTLRRLGERWNIAL